MHAKHLILAITLTMISATLLVYASPGFELVDSYWLSGPAPNVASVLRVVLRYTHASGNVSLNATLKVMGVGGLNVEANASYLGYLAQGSTLNLNFELDLPEGPYASFYPATLNVSYNTYSLSLDFQVGFANQPSFTVSSSATTLKKGEANIVNLIVYISNAPARNLDVRVTPASAFATIIGGSLSRHGLVRVGEKLQLPFTLHVDSAAGDSVAVSVTISYEDFSRTPGTQTVTLGFQTTRSKGSPSISCSLSPNRIQSGQRTSTALIVANTGVSVAKDVRVALTSLSPGVALLSGSTAYLGDLAPGESKSVGLLLRADRTAVGVAQLQLSISYFDEYGDSRVSTVSVGFEVARSPEPVLTVELLNSSLPYGLNSFMAVKIANVGGSKALDVVVDAVPGGGFYVLSQSRVKVGVIDPGTVTTIPFLVRVETLSGSVTATLRLRYYDEYGYEYNDLVQASLNVTRTGPHLAIRVLNATLYPNKVNRVALMLVNVGSTKASNVSVALTSQSPEIGAVIGSSTINLGSVEPNKTVLAEFYVFVQPRLYGAFQLLAGISYSGIDGRSYREVYTVGFEVRGTWELSVAAASTIPPIVFPGDNLVQLIVALVNSGDYMARDLEVKFIGNEWVKPVSEGAAVAFIPYMPVGQSLTLTFLVAVDEKAIIGNHRLRIDASGSPLYFTLTILEKATFTVRNVSSLNMVSGGRGYKLVYEVENASNSTAEDVRVELFSPFVTGTTSVYLGTLSPGERKLAVFEVNIDSAAPPGQLPLDVKVSWKQQQRSLSQYARSHMFVEAPRALSPFAIAAVALVAGALIVYYKRSLIVQKLIRWRGGKLDSS